MGILEFNNKTAQWKVKIKVSKAAIPHIMDWYGGYCAGDEYSVKFKGKAIIIDQNGSFVCFKKKLKHYLKKKRG